MKVVGASSSQKRDETGKMVGGEEAPVNWRPPIREVI